jgi:leucyl-tRNA synthetase
MRQWILRMTDYADRLLYDLDEADLDWEDSIVDQQKNWIGRSEGAQFDLAVKNSEFKIEVYTTRLDTVYGMTYAVVAPEHEIIGKLKDRIENYSAVEEYVINAQNKTTLERTELQKEKTGVELKGVKVINPFTQKEIPLFVADYVLGFYGTGAVMAVPAHDERDFEFAKKYNLPIEESVAPYIKDNPREDKETEVRDCVAMIVKNPKDNTYLCLNWKTTEWKSFPSGGVDGEDLVVAGKREIEEETGYKNVKFIKQIGDSVFAEFYRPHKGSNVFANFKYLLFELENEECSEVVQKELDQHEPVWVTEEKVGEFLSVWNQKIAWKRYLSGDFAYCEDGIVINSGKYSGLKSQAAREQMTAWLEENKIGQKKVNYKMRDWVFSRQRYWGEPIPIIHCEKCGAVGVPEDQLPVVLPEVENYEPTGTGEGPLAKITDWVNVACPKCGGVAKRETNTMPQWAGSSWYYLRYADAKNNQVLIGKEVEKEWLPVDLYVGGAEHATRHLLYARFWHKFLFDLGVVSSNEPFKKLMHVGLIAGEDGRKMSKRWGNVVNPDAVVAEFGADAMRLYEMFMGPFSQGVSWSTEGVKGVRKFLEKVWNFQSKIGDGGSRKLTTLVHKTVKKVGDDIPGFRFNTAVSAMMILANAIEKEEKIPQAEYEMLLKILSPFAPHMTEEIWSSLGNDKSIFTASWPEYSEELSQDEEIELVVQINGKVRDRLTVAADISEDEAKKLALASEKIQGHIGSKEIKKIIFVQGKLISIVI